MIQHLPCPANWWVGENQDSALTGLHDAAMFRKYGYGRGCAQISVDIRNGLISRRDALNWVREHDGMFPWVYMGIPATAAAEHIGMSLEDVFAALDKHTNHELFDDGDCINDGRPILKEFAAECLQPA
jgi:hypothetical protein